MAKSTTKTLPRKQGKPAGVAKSQAQQSHAQQSLKIAHAIAQSGLASRRTAEAWVRAGAVSLKGTVLREPAQRLTPAEIRHLRVRGVPLPQLEPPRLWRYHKPRGVLVERRGAKTGARKIGKDGAAVPYLDEVLPTRLRGLHAVGRLDLDSEGLLLLTNNGALKRALELPRNGVVRRYRLRVFGIVSERDLARLARGPKLDGQATQVRSVRLMGAQKAQQKVSGGKNRKQKKSTNKRCNNEFYSPRRTALCTPWYCTPWYCTPWQCLARSCAQRRARTRIASSCRFVWLAGQSFGSFAVWRSATGLFAAGSCF